jgi:hypothetical protein
MARFRQQENEMADMREQVEQAINFRKQLLEHGIFKEN